jgi:hypothetical protein
MDTNDTNTNENDMNENENAAPAPVFAFRGFRTRKSYTAAIEVLTALAQGDEVILTGSDNVDNVTGILDVFAGHVLVTDTENDTATIRALVRARAKTIKRAVEYAPIAGAGGNDVAYAVRFAAAK